MAKLFSSLFRRTRRRIKPDLRDQSTYKLYTAACRLLRDHDHEQMSVAQVTKAAGISVGGFYRRFPNKDAFLRLVLAEHFYGSRNYMERVLSHARWDGQPTGILTAAIVEQMMRDLHGPGAGVVRAALKLGHVKREKLEPLESYRRALADAAVTLLAPRTKHPRQNERTVRDSVQMAEATVLDALLHEGGSLRPGSRRMAAVLSTMMLDALGLSPGQSRKAHDDLGETDDDTGMLEMPITEVVAVEVPQTALPPRRYARRRGVLAASGTRG